MLMSELIPAMNRREDPCVNVELIEITYSLVNDLPEIGMRLKRGQSPHAWLMSATLSSMSTLLQLAVLFSVILLVF